MNKGLLTWEELSDPDYGRVVKYTPEQLAEMARRQEISQAEWYAGQGDLDRGSVEREPNRADHNGVWITEPQPTPEQIEKQYGSIEINETLMDYIGDQRRR